MAQEKGALTEAHLLVAEDSVAQLTSALTRAEEERAHADEEATQANLGSMMLQQAFHDSNEEGEVASQVRARDHAKEMASLEHQLAFAGDECDIACVSCFLSSRMGAFVLWLRPPSYLEHSLPPFSCSCFPGVSPCSSLPPRRRLQQLSGEWQLKHNMAIAALRSKSLEREKLVAQQRVDEFEQQLALRTHVADSLCALEHESTLEELRV